jgi:hypothetical protein
LSNEDAAEQVGRAQVGAPEVGPDEIGHPQVDAPEVRPDEVRTAQAGAPQVGTPEIGSGQVRTPVIDGPASDAGSHALARPEQEFIDVGAHRRHVEHDQRVGLEASEALGLIEGQPQVTAQRACGR